MMAIRYTTTYQQPQKTNLNSASSSFIKERAFLQFEITFVLDRHGLNQVFTSTNNYNFKTEISPQ